MITPICPIKNINPIYSSRTVASKNLTVQNRNVNFCGKDIRYSITLKVIESIRDKNLIGESSNSKVYRFADSSIDKYVIKVLKPNANTYPQLNELPKYNFGQTVSRIQHNVYILRKQNGIQPGFEIWTEF